uniref:Calcium uptake protein 1 homolog, mitochondrial n=1 Tax=Cacopsylla melanoneura TaxID=428564 RepID=A0A8D8TSK4_9HEMI
MSRFLAASPLVMRAISHSCHTHSSVILKKTYVPQKTQVCFTGYSRFGHRPDPPAPKFRKYYYLLIVSAMIVPFIDFAYLKEWYDYLTSVEAASPKSNKDETKAAKIKEAIKSDTSDSEDVSDDELAEEVGKNKKRKKENVGFRDRKIIEYENRIRHFSTPDKVFRYFATLQVSHVHANGSESHEIFMTPDDFLRSMTPGIKQPDGLGLDQFKKYDPKNVHMKLELALDEDSIFYKLGSSGLITFSDYIFLLTVLSTSRRHFEIAFRMFDLNGDGDVDSEEFEKVATLIRQQTSIGSRHRDHANTGHIYRGVNSALTTYFFGENKDEKLTIEKFLDFQHQLQKEILSLEFIRKGPNDDGNITEGDFTELLLAYAGYPPKKKSRIIKHVKKTFKPNKLEPEEGEKKKLGISQEDYLKFFHFLNNINDVDTALTFYHIAGASIDAITLKHVARTVAHVELDDHVIEVVFCIFDENGDGQLSNREFVAVMKNRLMRGLEKPKDTGFVKFIQSIGKCAENTVFEKS